MSMRFTAAINKPGFNPLAASTSTYLYNLYSWGTNAYGQLGINSTTNYSSPKQVGALTAWNAVSCGWFGWSVAIKNDGTLWTWGRNSSGQLGLGNTTYYSSPKQVGALTNWLSLAAGYYQVTALKTDGTLWAWGRNNVGQLGLGNITDYSSPKQIGSLTTWKTFASGGYHILAVKTDGTLWVWGYNNLGQLGLGNLTFYSSPKQVGSLSNWSKVAGGGNNTLAVKTDGTLWSWGNNSYGQLGNGNITKYSSPVQVGALTNWSKPFSGAGNNFVGTIKTDGTLWVWGRNNMGQLGLGTNSNAYSSPKQVGSLTTWAGYTNGANFSLAFQTNGTLWSWGRNDYGQLGLGNNTYYSSPKQVGSTTTWSAIAAGADSLLALN